MQTYALASGDVLEVLRDLPSDSFDAAFCDPPYGFRFMGKTWDYDVPSVETWAELLRVLKPGAPLLAFGGARTYHRLACGIEDAGFELRDCLMWLYAKGFPKSQNIVKAGAPEVWEGYGTALKPAHEPIALARKPLIGTMVRNIAAHGVGGLNIGGCRIGEQAYTQEEWTQKSLARTTGNAFGVHAGSDGPVPQGRWPANLLLDEEAGAALDASVPAGKSTPYPEHAADGAVLPLSKRTAGGYSDAGGPSRFFYCAKVSTKEREQGCELLPLKSAGEVTDREDGTAGLASPRAGAGRGGRARNHHPTLKPVAITEYLAKLILPPTHDACLLVPFSGSGSEVIGALKAGWPCVLGIEKESEYLAIANARIPAWVPEASKVA